MSHRESESFNRKKRQRASTRKLSSTINEEELIRQVAARPILYDRSLKAYRKSGLRHQYWKEVGQTMGANLEECRRRWRSLRDAFAKHYKYATKVGEEQAAKRKKWIFYDQMTFIGPFLDNASYEIDEHLLEEFSDDDDDDPTMNSLMSELAGGDNDENPKLPPPTNDKNTTSTGISRKSTVEQVPEIEEEEEEDEPTEDEPAEDEPKFTPTAGLRLHSTDFLPQIEIPAIITAAADAVTIRQAEDQCKSRKERSKSPAATGATNVADDTSDEKFLLSCVPALRRLSNRKNALARLKIQQVLYEIEFGSES